MSGFQNIPLDRHLRNRLVTLLEAALNLDSTTEQSAEFESLLVESDAAREFAVEYLHLDALLARYECRSASPREALPPQIAVGPAAKPVLGFLLNVMRHVPGGEFTVGLLVLAVVGIAFWGLANAFHGGMDGDPSPAASLLASEDAQWLQPPRASLPADSHADPTAIAEGEPLELAAGTVEFKLKLGATLRIEGPAEWTIDGHNRATLQRGKLVANVPPQAVGFTLETPAGRIVDLGTRFSVEVAADGDADVKVLQGAVEVQHARAAAHNAPTLVRAGSSVIVRAATGSIERISDVAQVNPAARKRAPEPVPPFRGIIPLGNLFDDRPPYRLVEAVVTDTYAAVPDRDHLGVERVYVGGPAIREIAPGIWLDVSAIGWLEKEYSQPTNDVACLEKRRPSSPIQTLGKKLTNAGAKIEDGIGMHADSLITFNLDEIRQAGALEDVPLRFVCDRFGLNDDAREARRGSVHCLVVISSSTGILDAYLNGAAIPAKLEGKAFQLIAKPTKAFTPDSKPATCDIRLPAEARYLTLGVTTSGDSEGFDHGVWSGVRLVPEIER